MGIIYGFQYTTTALNIHHIFDFIDYMVEKDILIFRRNRFLLCMGT
jgi:hypothetical protein